MKDRHVNVRTTAVCALKGGTDITLDVIERWEADEEPHISAIAKRMLANADRNRTDGAAN